MQQDTETLSPTPSHSLTRPGDLTFLIDYRAHDARLAVIGQLDHANKDSMSRAGADLLRPPVRALLLDLDGVSFFGAAGVTALIDIRKAAAEADTRLVLTGIRPHVRRVLDLTRTTDLIPIAHTRATEPATAGGHTTEVAGSLAISETIHTRLPRAA
jgi:anti-anti-sigma factor